MGGGPQICTETILRPRITTNPLFFSTQISSPGRSTNRTQTQKKILGRGGRSFFIPFVTTSLARESTKFIKRSYARN